MEFFISFIVFIVVFITLNVSLRHLKIEKKEKPKDENLYDENYDPLAEMLSGGTTGPVDIQRVIKYLETIAASMDGWVYVSAGDWKHVSGIKWDPKVSVKYVFLNEERVKFLQEDDWDRIRKIFQQSVEEKKVRDSEEEKARQVAEFQKILDKQVKDLLKNVK